MASVVCPHCSQVMRAESYEGASLHRCGACGGVWVGMVDMRLIVQRREEVFVQEVVDDVRQRVRQRSRVISPEEKKRQLPCPVCATKMPPFLYNYSSGIVINQCPKDHGVFLDQGELERVQAHAEFMDAAAAGNVSTYLEYQQPHYDELTADALSEAEREAEANWRHKKAPVLNRLLDWLARMKK